MRCFGDVFEKHVFDNVLQNAKHRANDASNDVNRPPLGVGGVRIPPKNDDVIYEQPLADRGTTDNEDFVQTSIAILTSK